MFCHCVYKRKGRVSVKKQRSSWEACGVALENVRQPARLLRAEAVHLDCILLTAMEVVRFPRGTVAVAVVADSYGTAEEAGGSAEVAGAGVGDVVIATDWLFGWEGYWARGCAAHDAVSAVCLVCNTGVGTWANHVGA